MATGTLSRKHALIVARAQREIYEASENLHALSDELSAVVVAVEGAPTDRSDEAQAAFWEPFYAEVEAEIATVTA